MRGQHIAPSESDMADLASFPGLENRFLSASIGEDSVRNYANS